MSLRWLASAFGIAIAVAAVLAYLMLSILFYQGQWQLILHPSRSITATPSSKFEEIHFDYTQTGDPRLDGWWVPAAQGASLGSSPGSSSGSRWGDATVLYLHGGKGSLSNNVADVDALHVLGVNVFAFDYRGYGKSMGPHPTEARMNADADAAWNYLTVTRHLDPKKIILYGKGVGSSLAAELASRHAPAGVVLDAPNEPAEKVIVKDGRAELLPGRLLLHERFDPAEALTKLAAPKLFLDRNGSKPRTEQLFKLAASPKQYFELKADAGCQATMERFLDGALR